MVARTLRRARHPCLWTCGVTVGPAAVRSEAQAAHPHGGPRREGPLRPSQTDRRTGRRSTRAGAVRVGTATRRYGVTVQAARSAPHVVATINAETSTSLHSARSPAASHSTTTRAAPTWAMSMPRWAPLTNSREEAVHRPSGRRRHRHRRRGTFARRGATEQVEGAVQDALAGEHQDHDPRRRGGRLQERRGRHRRDDEHRAEERHRWRDTTGGHVAGATRGEHHGGKQQRAHPAQCSATCHGSPP